MNVQLEHTLCHLEHKCYSLPKQKPVSNQRFKWLQWCSVGKNHVEISHIISIVCFSGFSVCRL